MLEKLALADLALERKIHAGLDAIENVTGITAQQVKAVLDSHIMRNLPSVLLGASGIREGSPFLLNSVIITSMIYFYTLLQKKLQNKANEVEKSLTNESASINVEVRSIRILVTIAINTALPTCSLIAGENMFFIGLGMTGSCLMSHPFFSTYISNHPGMKRKNSTKDKLRNFFSKISPTPQVQLVPIPVKN